MQTVECTPRSGNNSKTIHLDYPVIANGVVTEKFNMRRPLVRDRLVAEKVKGSEIEKEIRLMANLCEVAPTDIENLDMADYAKLQECLTGFLS